ncbi:MAG: T9SS type A sorting domain-containing protein [Flavobacteriales bacterium]|nr:T9SS type A sorting domain-containing protein [Flavobacteriales bacterium]
MSKQKAILVLVAIFTIIYGNAQHWNDLREQGESIQDIEAAFESEWDGREYEKGQGYKQYKRWHQFWESRQWGESIDISASLDFIQAIERRPVATSSMRDAGNWEPLGMESWESIGYAPGNGRINTIAHDPNNAQILYVGCPSGGIWKSEDAGLTWTPIGDQLAVMGVSALAVSHQNSNVIYAGTGDNDGSDTYGLGIFKSTDGGSTWSSTGITWDLGFQTRTHRILIDPNDSQIVFAATTDGLFKSVNGGISWYEVLNGNVRDIDFKADDSSIMFACKDRIYKSEDSGESFSAITLGLPTPGTVGRLSISVTPANPDYVYALFANNSLYAFQGLYRSTDGGDTWQLRSSTPNVLSSDEVGMSSAGQAWYDMEIAVSDQDANRVIVGGVNLWESDNGGLNWDLNAYWVWPPSGSNYVHADIHHLDFYDNKLWCGSDGGIFRSSNEGSSFVDLSDGLQINQFYRLASFPGNSDLILAGAQDNGTNLRENGIWTHIYGADGMEVIFHPTDPEIFLISSQYGSIYKTENGGATLDWAASGITEDGAWTTPYIMSPINSNILYAGYENVWRSTDLGDSWIQISTFSNEQFRALAVGADAPNTVYGSTNNNIYRTVNGGLEWQSIENGLPNNRVTAIAVDPDDSQRIWVTFGDFNDGDKVYYSSNGGDTWENISGNLPNCPVNTIVYNDQTSEGIYIGTDLGVFYTDETLASWESFGQGLPNVIVTELEINYGDEKLLASTYGRGIWRSDLWHTPNEAPLASAELDQMFICAGETIQFSDASSLNMPGWEWTFEGGNPATSQEQFPQITYDNAGMYDFTLTVSNDAGTSTYTCEECVHVYNGAGNLQPMTEGFEGLSNFNQGDWYVSHTGAGPTWSVSGAAAHFGSKSAMLPNYQIDFEEEHMLTSRPLDLTNISDGETLYISYWYAYASTTGENTDRFRLYLSNDCGETFEIKQQINTSSLPTAGSIDSEYFAQEGDWVQEIYTLAPEDLGSAISMQFWFRSGNGNNFFLDDINLSNDINGLIVNRSKDLVSVYPNPASDFVEITIGGFDGQAYVNVYDLAGEKVEQFSIQGRSKIARTDTWVAGCYVFEILFDNQVVRKRVIIN